MQPVRPFVPADVRLAGPLRGPQAAEDPKRYRIWHKPDHEGAPSGKYLVDDAVKAVYLADPGINGSHTTRPDGTEVRKYDAPKAVLMSFIIKGILERQLPWALVLCGIMIALVLEMAGVPSLPFAVGVFLPLASSVPILIGGLVRRFVDRRNRRLPRYAPMTEEERIAASESRAGVLLASGYIAGGALAGIVIAIAAGVLTGFDRALGEWAVRNNPLFAGANADLLSLIPFVALVVLLYWTARERYR